MAGNSQLNERSSLERGVVLTRVTTIDEAERLGTGKAVMTYLLRVPHLFPQHAWESSSHLTFSTQRIS